MRMTQGQFAIVGIWGLVTPGTQLIDPTGARYEVTHSTTENATWISLHDATGGPGHQFDSDHWIDHDVFRVDPNQSH